MVNTPKPGYYISRPEKSKELSLLKAAKGPDLLEANKAKTTLITLNEGFLKSTITPWIDKNPQVSFNVLMNEAKVALLEAINNYDLKKDVSIRSYAKFYLLDLQRTFFKKSKTVELTEAQFEEGFTIPDFDTKSIDLREVLLKAVTTLTPVEQEVIKLHFFKGLKKREIAAYRRCSEARICAIVKEAIPKLRTYLKSSGIVPGNFNFN